MQRSLKPSHKNLSISTIEWNKRSDLSLASLSLSLSPSHGIAGHWQTRKLLARPWEDILATEVIRKSGKRLDFLTLVHLV